MPPDTAKAKRPAKKPSSDDGLTTEERIERDAGRYETLAREHGADLGEDGFNDFLRKIGKREPSSSQ